MSLKWGVRQIGDVSILDLSGRITLGEASAILRDEVRDLLSNGHIKVVLNLAEVSHIDSSGLGELVGAFATVGKAGGKLKLLNLQKRVRDLVQITKLYTVFESFTDEKEALRSFQAAAPAGSSPAS
jgi:anti-sigma B factor antagonist